MAKKEESKKLPELNIKSLQFNHVLVTADYYGKDSGILMEDGTKAKRAAKDVQTVLAIGPHVKDSGVIEVGDRVMIDTDKLSAKNSRIITLHYNKESNKMINADTAKELDKEDLAEACFLITDREILFPLT